MTLVPLLVVAATFEIFCLVHLARAHQVRYLPKPLWVLIILISIPLGGIVYLALGRPPTGRPVAHLDATGSPSDRGGRIKHCAGGTKRAHAGRGSGAGSIEVERLSKHFGRVVAVDDLSFEVRPGRVTGFLGPNGAGKTTTMRIVLGLQAPTSGRTALGGRSYKSITRPLHEVGALLDADAGLLDVALGCTSCRSRRATASPCGERRRSSNSPGSATSPTVGYGSSPSG